MNQMIKNLPSIRSTKGISRDKFEFDTQSRMWQLSRDNTVSLVWIDEFLSASLQNEYISVLKFYAETASAGHANNLNDRFRAFAKYIYSIRSTIDSITPVDLINYRSTLDKKHEWYLATVRGFLYTWDEFGYPGLGEGVIPLLESWTLRGNQKGLAVQTLDPDEGPLTKLEFEALHQAVIDGFKIETLDLEEFVLAKLFIATGRRPSQIGDLKVKDFIEASSSDGLQEFLLNIPRRKQRGGWRVEFNACALIPEIGIALKSLIDENHQKLQIIFPDLPQQIAIELPIFPDWKLLEAEHGSVAKYEMQEIFESQMFHPVTQDLSKKFTRIIDRLVISSDRTGTLKNVIPTRMRRTLATRAAREGYGVLVIAELLDHSDTQNATVYTENVPEHIYAINLAVGSQLEPWARAFQGQVIDSERDAIRGDDLTSRIRSANGKAVGNCGQNGFCGGFGPIACYTCRDFQAWLDAPHEEVLEWLISDRERKLALTKDETIATINDRTIYAVGEVIRSCEQRKTELTKAVTYG
jgi:integrase